MSDTFRAESRRDWQVNGIGVQPSDANLQLGCLQRIADATELMAKRYTELIDERNRLQRWYDQECKTTHRLTLSNNALRGQITKLKKKQVLA